MPPKRSTTWTTWVRDWADSHNISYPCASTDPECRKKYEEWKKDSGMKATQPRKAPGEPKRKYVRKDPNAPVVPKRKYVRKPKEDKMALSYILNPMPTDEQTKANRAAASARVKAMKAKKASNAPKRPPIAYGTRRAAASAKADKTWVDDWAKSIGASYGEAKPKRKYAPRKKREPTAAEFVSAVARLNANPSLMEWSKG